MGNNFSNQKKDTKSVSQILDYIATHYILTMDFNSLKQLYNKEYCDKLIILTSDIIQRYFTDMEITYLSQRIRQGVEVNELTKDNVIFFNKDKLNEFNIQNSIKKKRLCIGIAQFYIKIAHIFAAIITTINPVYLYKDANGETKKATLYEKKSIPKESIIKVVNLNLCDNRINSLQHGQSGQQQTGQQEQEQTDQVVINPTVCSINMNENGGDKSLADEPGIPELMELYYDDNYDFNTGKFTGMSETTQQMFKTDLNIFYKVFTGRSTPMPESITKFSDIKLRNYNKLPQCQDEKDPLFRKRFKGSLSDKLFKTYAENLTMMLQTANNNKELLLTIINQIFVYTIDPQTKQNVIRINPLLTEQKLQQIILETRTIIIKLYLGCERDYINGLKIYEAIIEQKLYETSQRQLNKLNELSESLYQEQPLPVPAEVTQASNPIPVIPSVIPSVIPKPSIEPLTSTSLNNRQNVIRPPNTNTNTNARQNVRPDVRQNVRPPNTNTRQNVRPDVRPNVRPSPDVRPRPNTNTNANLRPDVRPNTNIRPIEPLPVQQQNPESQQQNPESQQQNPESQQQNPESQQQNPESQQQQDLELQQDLEEQPSQNPEQSSQQDLELQQDLEEQPSQNPEQSSQQYLEEQPSQNPELQQDLEEPQPLQQPQNPELDMDDINDINGIEMQPMSRRNVDTNIDTNVVDDPIDTNVDPVDDINFVDEPVVVTEANGVNEDTNVVNEDTNVENEEDAVPDLDPLLQKVPKEHVN